MILKGKTAIITGASSGIGKAITQRFFKEGVNIFAVGRSDIAITKMIREVIDDTHNNTIVSLPFDISQEEKVQTAFDLINSTGKKIDILVNAAGIAESYSPIVQSDFSEWKRVFETNVFGTFLMMKYVLPQMCENQSGKIINFFGGGDGPLEGFSAYGASKAAVVRLTETIAKEVRPFGIDVNVIAPGPVKTRLFSEMFLQSKAFLQSGKIPPIPGDIEKPVELALFLASEKSNGLSGKFLSAVWDNWWKIPENLELIMQDPNVFTLRRVKEKL